ncbi:hypothetical protein J6590_061845 [Homalodisca vitripennis]|nr:hypothetical protein J6590_061845 [Homalodisca vitripennis]
MASCRLQSGSSKIPNNNAQFVNKYKRLPWVWLSLTYVERMARVEALRYQTIMHNLNKYKRLPWVWLSLTYVERMASWLLRSGSSKTPNTYAQFLNKCKRIPLGEAMSYSRRETGEVRLSYHELHASAADCGVEALRYQTLMHNLNKSKRIPLGEAISYTGRETGEVRLSYHELHASAADCRVEALRYQTLMLK